MNVAQYCSSLDPFVQIDVSACIAYTVTQMCDCSLIGIASFTFFLLLEDQDVALVLLVSFGPASWLQRRLSCRDPCWSSVHVAYGQMLQPRHHLLPYQPEAAQQGEASDAPTAHSLHLYNDSVIL